MLRFQFEVRFPDFLRSGFFPHAKQFCPPSDGPTVWRRQGVLMADREELRVVLASLLPDELGHEVLFSEHFIA